MTAIIEPGSDAATESSDGRADVLLRVEDLGVAFPTEDGVVEAVRGVSYEVKRNEVCAIVGESGCGKSVSTMALMGLLPRTAQITGRARYLDNDLIGQPERKVRGFAATTSR